MEICEMGHPDKLNEVPFKFTYTEIIWWIFLDMYDK